RAGGLVAWALVRQHRTRTGCAGAALAIDWCIAADGGHRPGHPEMSDVRQSRTLKMVNGSKPCGPLGDPQAPSPKRGGQDCGYLVPPHPNLLPQGEGEIFARALVIRANSVVLCLRSERERSGDCNGSVRIFQRC